METCHFSFLLKKEMGVYDIGDIIAVIFWIWQCYNTPPSHCKCAVHYNTPCTFSNFLSRKHTVLDWG